MAGCIDRGLAAVEAELEAVRADTAVVAAANACLDRTRGPCEKRREEFEALAGRLKDDPGPRRPGMGALMLRWLAGLFAGNDAWDLPDDNLELERFFRRPKSHERRIHGRRHAGVRLVQEGPTLLSALDAHAAHPGPFTAGELLDYRHAVPPQCQRDAMHRRRLMRRARSAKRRPALLAQLEAAYTAAS